MPCSYVHLSLEERRRLYRLREAKVPVAKIAAVMGRHRSTIHREISRNWSQDAEVPQAEGYWPMTAQDLAERRRGARAKLERHPELRDAVIDRLLSSDMRNWPGALRRTAPQEVEASRPGPAVALGKAAARGYDQVIPEEACEGARAVTRKTTLSFTDRHHRFLAQKVEEGVFATTSAAVASAVERLIEDEEARAVALEAMAERIRARMATPTSEFTGVEEAFGPAREALGRPDEA